MKYLIVTVRRETNPNLPTMKYPLDYKPLEVDANKQGPLIYDQGLALGGDIEEMLVRLKDTIADQYALDADMRIVTEAEANIWLAGVARVQARAEEQVTDSDRLQLIMVKTLLALVGNDDHLTQEDRDALNPIAPMGGVRQRGKQAKDLFSGG